MSGITAVIARIREIEATLQRLQSPPGLQSLSGAGFSDILATATGQSISCSSGQYPLIFSGRGQQVVNTAQQFLGVPYVWGGEGPRGFDCSGLVTYVFRQLGVELPHYTVSQAEKGTPVDRTALQPGDVIFFGENGGTGFLYHVGIYVGDNSFLHAPRTGDVVKVSKLEGRYDTNYACARRYL